MDILAIDLGKFNSMCCFFNTQTREYSFWRASTDRLYLRTVLEKFPADLVVMEACGASHYWAREMAKFGHQVKLLKARDVKAYVQGDKDDRHDAAPRGVGLAQPLVFDFQHAVFENRAVDGF